MGPEDICDIVLNDIINVNHDFVDTKALRQCIVQYMNNDFVEKMKVLNNVYDAMEALKKRLFCGHLDCETSGEGWFCLLEKYSEWYYQRK